MKIPFRHPKEILSIAQTKGLFSNSPSKEHNFPIHISVLKNENTILKLSFPKKIQLKPSNSYKLINVGHVV